MPQSDYKFVIGADDSGRGAIAGPVVVAMVFHPIQNRLQYLGATDSKNTSVRARELFMAKLHNCEGALITYAATDAAWINRVGPDDAEASNTLSAFDQMHLKLERPDFSEIKLMVDGNKHYPNMPRELRVDYLPKGDGYIPLISAASIVATFIRDKLICELDIQYPGWGFLKHRGYDTEAHRIQLYEEGPQPFHHLKGARKAACSHAIKHKMPIPKWLAPRAKDKS